ncbi:hypothetical protein HOY80DRAFT_582469 [Tuber brumale]|nr:hypothetical protein HOY80DRAFT_582469 [Tuber brumale]
MTIIQSRLSGVPSNIKDPRAIQFASRRVAAVSGNTGSALDICRRAVEIVQYPSNKEGDGQAPSSPSKRKARVASSLSRGGGLKAGGGVPIAIVKKLPLPLYKCSQKPPPPLQDICNTLLLRSSRSGVGEGVLCDVLDEAETIGRIWGHRCGETRRGGGRVRLLIGEEVKALLREDPDAAGVVRR